MPAALTAEPLRDTFRVPKRRRQVPAVRARVRAALEKWGFDHLAPDVESAVCELVTNAIVHCRVALAEIEVSVHVDGDAVVLEVSDPDRDRLPVLNTDWSEEAEGGRGLLLVAALAADWGCRKGAFTKCVWARFRLTAGLPR
ncbi:ATP-binding protein [Streptomyces sp. NPDC096310]|uniref:ATP-binding protein n=1 Tax=Streptomyces sp. NPDC096310 TaxID=3366082 RepID=UPI0037FA6B07